MKERKEAVSRERRGARTEGVKTGMGGKRNWKEGQESISFYSLKFFIWLICVVIPCLC